MVETVLPSSEPVAGLYAFVKSILNEAAQLASFLLCKFDEAPLLTLTLLSSS